MDKYDLVIIGGGPGGYEAAIEASAVCGMKTALVENRELGGTCLNRGCIPTKALLHSAELFCELKTHGETLGIKNTDSVSFDMADIIERKNEVVSRLTAGVESLMKTHKVALFRGTGSITEPGKVRVTADGEAPTVLEAKNILIATGSVPARLPIPGADSPRVLTSDELLDIRRPIKDLIIIGGGVIGCEFASVFSALGTKVTIIEALPSLISNLDKELGRSLSMIFKKSRGIDIHTGAAVSSIEETEGGIVCRYTEKDEPRCASAELLLMAAGRQPNTAGLIAQDASDEIKALKTDRGRILVNDTYLTSVPGIYAIGDVIGGIQLAHAATAEGRSAVSAMNGASPSVNTDIVPSCIYTSPEIASVGLTSDEAKESGIEVITKKYPMSANGKTVLSLQERSFMKVVADKETGKILGAQLMCARATDMISQFSQAIVNGLTLNDMAKLIYPHPTFSEAIGETVR